VVAGSLAFAMLALTVGTGVAVWKADEARESAKNEAAQKTIAEGKTDEANKEAARADAEADKVWIELKESQRRIDLSRLKEAQSYFESNLVQLARDTLNEIAPENRCVAWGILNRRFEGSLFALWGHTEEVTSVAVSVDGRRIVTGSFDQTARVWDAQSGASLLELKGHTGSVRAAKWSR